MFERFRTQRTDEGTRLQFRETFLRAADFILPLFIVPGFRQCREISGLPGVNYYSADMLPQALAPLIKMGVQRCGAARVDADGIAKVLETSRAG